MAAVRVPFLPSRRPSSSECLGFPFTGAPLDFSFPILEGEVEEEDEEDEEEGNTKVEVR